MITREEDWRDAIFLLFVFKDIRTCIDIGRCGAGLFERCDVTEDTRDLTSDRVHHDHRGKLPSCEDERTDRDVLHFENFLHTSIDAFIATTDEDDISEICIRLRHFFRGSSIKRFP